MNITPNKLARNARVLLEEPEKRVHYCRYLLSKLAYGMGLARVPLGGRVGAASFSEYLSILNLLPNEPELKFMSSQMRDAAVALDIGANVGAWSVLMNKLNPHCRIISFEPNPQIFKSLEANVRLNGAASVEAVHAAVADIDDVVDFEIPEKAAIFARLVPRHNSSLEDGRFEKATVVKVNGCRLDTFCHEHQITQIDFLKIDVEGFELAALKGLGSLLANKKVRAIHIETIRENHERAGESFDGLLSFVQSQGYSFYLLDENGFPSQRVPIDCILHHNHVCLPD